MILDCFIINDELDMIEFRLEEHYESFDYFIIVESNLTHSGLIKPLHFAENKERFSKFSDKIIYVLAELPQYVDENLTPEEYHKILGNPQSPSLSECYTHFRMNKQGEYFWGPWIREHLQRDAIKLGTQNLNLQDTDIIYMSDVDEILDVEIIEIISGKKEPINFPIKLPVDQVYCVLQKFYYYDLEHRVYHNWDFARIFNYGSFKKINSFNSIRYTRNYPPIGDYGWHFSFFGGVKQIMNKLKSYSHQEFNNENLVNEKNISEKIKNSLDILGRDSGIKDKFVSYTEFNPTYYWPRKINKLKKLFQL